MNKVNVFANQEMAANSTEVSSMARPAKSFPTQDIRLFSPRLDFSSYLFWEDFPDITSSALPRLLTDPPTPGLGGGPAVPDKGAGSRIPTQSTQEYQPHPAGPDWRLC